MSERISGQNITLFVGPALVTFEKVTLNIEDTSKAVHSKGLPNGFVRGKLSASGEVEVDTANFMLLQALALAAGSWQGIGTWDAIFTAYAGETVLNVIADECLFKVTKVLDAGAEGGDKLMHTLPFEVTGQDFVRINGVPYHESDRFLGII